VRERALRSSRQLIHTYQGETRGGPNCCESMGQATLRPLQYDLQITLSTFWHGRIFLFH
jgi:hypothetical protein